MPGPSRFSPLCALALLLPAGAPAGPATPSPRATVPPASAAVTVTLVQLEVRVEDKKGSFISGLRPGDFQVFEDGVAQQLEFVDEISETTRSDARPAVTPTPGARPEPERRQAPEERATLIAVVDRASSSGESIRRQRKHLDGLLAALEGKGIVVALIEIKPNGGYEILSDFSDNLGAARRAVERLASGGAGGSDRRGKVEQMESVLEQKLGQCGSARTDPESQCREAAFRGLIHTAITFAQESRATSVTARESLTAILRFADHLPGSRSLLLVSEGLDPGGVSYLNTAAQLMRFYGQNMKAGDTQRYISEIQREAGLYSGEIPRIQELTELALASNVTVHWVNPAHSSGVGGFSAEQQFGDYTGTVEVAQAADAPRLMKGLADDTGGLALTRAAGLDDFFARLARDLNTYYRLSYTPAGRSREGTDHAVEVKTTRPKARVRMRRTYVDLVPQQRIDRTLAAALDFPDMFATFSAATSLSYLYKGKTYHVQLRVAVPHEEIFPDEKDGKVTDTLHFGYAVHDQRDELVKSGAPILALAQPSDEFARLVASRGRIDYGYGFDLPPGRYRLATAVLDRSNLRTATRTFDLILPAPGESCLAVTPLMVAHHVSPAAARAAELSFDADGHVLWNDQSLAFSAVLAFEPTGKLTGVYQILNAAAAPDGTPDVRIFFRLFAGNSFLNQTPPTALTRFTDAADRSLTSVFSVPYSRLAPGDYRLELVAHDNRSGCEAVGSAPFTVVATADPAGAGKKD